MSCPPLTAFLWAPPVSFAGERNGWNILLVPFLAGARKRIIRAPQAEESKRGEVPTAYTEGGRKALLFRLNWI